MSSAKTMSRRFSAAYPPPCNSKNGVRGQPLIGSIKRERQTIKTAQRKDNKWERNNHDSNDGSVNHFSLKEKRKYDWIGGYDDANDELRDRSGVTEEPGEINLTRSPSYLSDGSQRAKKQKTEISVADSTPRPKNILKIKFTSSKSREPVSRTLCREPNLKNVVQAPLKEQSYYTKFETAKEEDDEEEQRSDITEEQDSPTGSQSLTRKIEASPLDSTQKRGTIIWIKLPSKKQSEPVISTPICSKPLKREVHHISQKEQNHSIKSETVEVVESKKEKLNLDPQTKDGFTGKVSKIVRESMSYKSLIEDWVPPPIEFVQQNDDDGEDWLWSTMPKRPQSFPASATTVWSSAQYLPEVGTVALPYVIPFC